MNNVISIVDKIKEKMKKDKKKKLSVEEHLDSWVKLIEKHKLKSFFAVCVTDDNQVIYNCSSGSFRQEEIIGAVEVCKHDLLIRNYHSSPSTIVEE